MEHVFNYQVAVKNVMKMVKVGGHVVSICPSNNSSGHGFYQFSSELVFRVFSNKNGFESPVVLFKERGLLSKWYRITDPRKIGRRVIRRRGGPALLYVSAKKREDEEKFKEFPQQSDYAAIWNNHPSAEKPSTGVLKNMVQYFPNILMIPLVRFKERVTRGPFLDKSAYKPYRLG